MTSPTPQDVREIAARAITDWLRVNADTFLYPGAEWPDIADAVLAAVEPVIRQQVAEEIARAIGEAPRERLLDIPAMRLPPLGHTGWVARQVRDLVAAAAAAIARSHSTQPGEETK